MKLRDFKKKDAEPMLEWMHSELSQKVFAKDFNSFTKDKVLDFIENAKNYENQVHLACVDEKDNYLGTVSLKNINNEDKNAEYAISFHEKAFGTGASTYATKEILRIAFEELKLQKVYLNVLDINERANAFYKKIGFKKVGIFYNHILKSDGYKNLVWYEIQKEEYEKNSDR